MDQPALCLVGVPPGAQAALFHLPVDGAPAYTVLDRDGNVQTRTTSLGVAMTAARHLVAEHREAWVRTTDDTTAHIGPDGVTSDTPTRPWIRTLTTTLETSP